MFNWLGNLFPYSDLHSLNLDWILSKMKETAAQAAKAIADSANALAQVIEAKTAAQNAQTAAQNAQTAANNAQMAADNAADSAGNAVDVAQAAKSAAQTAQNTADAAKSAAQTAQSTAQTAQNTANTAQSAAQTAQNTANTAQDTAQTALDKFPVKTADIANGAVLADKIGAYQITSGKIADGAVTPNKLGPNEIRLNEHPIGFPAEMGSININYNGTSLIAASSNSLYDVLYKNFDTPLARIGGSVVSYERSELDKRYKQLYIKTPILFYTSVTNTDIPIRCGLTAISGENVEFDVIIHNNGDGTGTTTINMGSSVISGSHFTCQIKVAPFACELHRAAK